jgi:hypothetical protein
VTIDRGYSNDRVLGRLTPDGNFFVTGQKVNAWFNLTERFEMDWQCGLISDYYVVLLGQKGNAYPAVL